MRQIGLVERKYASSVAFLDSVRSGGSLALSAGAIAALVGAVMLGVVHGATPDTVFAVLAGVGLLAAYSGAQVCNYASRARDSLRTPPQTLQLSTYPYTRATRGRRVEYLQAIVVADAEGPAAAFRVSCGSFGAKPLDHVPANVYGPLTPGSVALVACGEGFAFGRVDQTRQPLAPGPAAAPPSGARRDPRMIGGMTVALLTLALILALGAVLR